MAQIKFKFHKDYCEVKSSPNLKGDVVIPQMAKKMGKKRPVTIVQSYAFSQCTNLNSISFQEDSDVEYIGESSFPGCLKKLILPPRLRSCGIGLARRTDNLIEIDISSQNKDFCVIDKKYLYNKDKTILYFVARDIEYFVVPKTVNNIKPYALHKKMKTLAFENGSELEDLDRKVFPKNLEKLALPPKLKTIFQKGLQQSDNLKEIEISPSNELFGNVNKKELINKNQKELIFVCRDIEEFIVPKEIKQININAFRYIPKQSYYGITREIVEPKLLTLNFEEDSEIKEINYDIFPNSLQNLSFPPKLKKIDEKKIAYLKNLKSISFHDDSKIIKFRSFDFLQNLSKITLPPLIKNIDESFISEAGKLVEISISLKSEYYCDIGKKALLNKDKTELIFLCYDVTDFVVPKTVKVIKSYAFKFCNQIQTIQFEDNSEYEVFGENVLPLTLTKLKLPQKLKEIDENWLSEADNLTEIEIPTNSEHFCDVNKSALINKDKRILLFVCKNIIDFVVPNIVVTIRPNAFQYCHQIKSISFEKNSDLEQIGKHDLPKSLLKLELPLKLTMIEENYLKLANNLEEIKISPANEYFCDIDQKALISERKTELIFICRKAEKLFIPKTIKKIRPHAISFDNNHDFGESSRDNLQILLEQKKISLNTLLFEEDSELESIEKKVFAFTKNLKQKVILPNSVEFLGNFSFLMSGITSIECEGAISSIGKRCFAFCPNLIRATFLNTEKITISENAFEDCNCKLIVLEGTVLEGEGVPKNVEYVPKRDFSKSTHPIRKAKSTVIFDEEENTLISMDLTSVDKDKFGKILREKDEKIRETQNAYMKEHKEKEKILKENKVLKKMIKKIISKNNGINDSGSSENQERKMFLGEDELKEMETIEEIGRGATAQVIKAKRERNVTIRKIEKGLYALKILLSSEVQNMKSFIREFEMMKEIGVHPCLMDIEGFSYGSTEKPPTIVLKYYPTTLLKEVSSKTTTLSNTEKVRIIIEIIIGMIYLQEKHDMIHRDLKPENILLTKNKHVRIGDFGLMTIFEPVETSLTKGVGTLQYMAPELLNNEKYSKKVDQYAFGKIVYYILMNGKLPEFKMKDAINGKMFPIPETIPEIGKEIITKCCSNNEDERPPFTQILQQLKDNKFGILPNIDVDELNERMIYIEMKESLLASLI